jgi:SAM-dependent methyltransferase
MPTKLEEARSALAAEWTSSSPSTPDEIGAFYAKSSKLGGDLDAWHETTDRQKWTEALVYVAQKVEARLAVDIGCGGGHDLIALREAGIPQLIGVEPNDELRKRSVEAGFHVVPDVSQAMLEDADLLVCIEVLEHVTDPEAFLGDIAHRARVGGERPGAVLVESTGTFDIGTPLHLKSNRGWHPGRVLEKHGFQLIDHSDRLRVWQRVRAENVARSTLLLCAYRTVSVPTLHSMLALSGVTSTLVDHDTGSQPAPNLAESSEGAWRVTTKTGDGLVSRARSIIASRWWAETADDVFLMVDDDIIFTVEDAEKVVKHAQETEGIVCAAYPVRSGAHLAIRGNGDNDGAITFDKDQPLQEIEYAATGFIAVHRKVLDAMVPTLEIVHEDQPWAFWPMFAPMVRQMGEAKAYLSEDWAFCARAIDLGFKVYVDPSIKLGHLAQIQMDVSNMSAIAKALGVKPLTM